MIANLEFGSKYAPYFCIGVCVVVRERVSERKREDVCACVCG